MPEFSDRLICFFTLPEKFFREVELKNWEGTLWVALVTLIHGVILFLLGVGGILPILILPVKMLLALLVFSFLVYFNLKITCKGVDFGTVYCVLAYSYFMASSVHLLIYVLIFLPVKFALLVLLVFFGGLFFGLYLAVIGLSHRLREKPIKIFVSIAIAVATCILFSIHLNFDHLKFLFSKLKG